MRKSTLNFIVDLVSLLAMVGMIATGLLLKYVLPPGSGHAGKVVWGLGRHDWGDVHFYLSVAILGLMLVHVALHWAWVCTMTRKLFTAGRPEEKKLSTVAQNLYGVGLLIALVAVFGAFLWIASASVAYVAVDDQPGRHNQQLRGQGRLKGSLSASAPTSQSAQNQHETQEHDDAIRGFMTLADVEKATGVPAAHIKSKLDLPDSVSPNERLGRLKQQHGFEMSAVRRIVDEYLKAKDGPDR